MDLTTTIDAMIRDAEITALPEWDGMPLVQFTSTYWPPTGHDAANERVMLERRRRPQHSWHRAVAGGRMELDAHDLHEYTADLRCRRGTHPGAETICQCVGEYLTQIICSRCEWHVIDSEKRAVEAWHDHAFPGWRALPLLPDNLRGKMGTNKMTPKLATWLEDNYPDHLRVEGAPILTRRDRIASRHVPGYSPFRGYDIGIITD